MSLVPLSPEEVRAWYPFVAVTGKLFAVLDTNLRHNHGLNWLDFHVLLALHASVGNKARMSDLAEFSGVDPSTMTYRVAKMERAGLVERNEDESDRRVVNASITDAGRKKLLEAMPDQIDGVRSNFLDHLDAAQREAIADIFSKMMVIFDLPWDGPGNPPEEWQKT